MMEVLQVVKYSLKQRLREGVGPQLLAREEELQDELVSSMDAPLLLREGCLGEILRDLHGAEQTIDM